MATGPGLRFFVDIAYDLARRQGRLEIDYDEAKRILGYIVERYKHDYFADDEVMVKVGPREYQPLKKVLEDARRRGETGPFLAAIRDCSMLTDAAAKRLVGLLQASGLDSAPRLLAEWSELDASDRRPPKARGKPEPKPEERNTIAPTRKRGRKGELGKRVEAQMRDELETGQLTIEKFSNMLEKQWPSRYAVSRTTARNARNRVLADTEFIDKCRQKPTNDKKRLGRECD
jgi:hypothetical protein